MLGNHLSGSERDEAATGLIRISSAGLEAPRLLDHRLRTEGITSRRVLLPPGHDPNSFFVQGGDARQFQSLLEAAPL